MEQFDMILRLCGIGFIASIIVASLLILKDWLKDIIDNLKYKYKRKHRFDKPPIAKCYCKDCIYYRTYNNDTEGRCIGGHISKWIIADSSFCWMAEPLKHDPDIK